MMLIGHRYTFMSQFVLLVSPFLSPFAGGTNFPLWKSSLLPLCIVCCINGRLVWIAVSLKSSRILFILSGFYMHYLHNADFTTVCYLESSFISDPHRFSPSISLRGRNKSKNQHGRVRPNTNLNKQTNNLLPASVYWTGVSGQG